MRELPAGEPYSEIDHAFSTGLALVGLLHHVNSALSVVKALADHPFDRIAMDVATGISLTDVLAEVGSLLASPSHRSRGANRTV